MKKFTLIAAMAAMMLPAAAEELFIPTYVSNPNIEIIQNGRFDPVTSNIGNTNDQTVICIGEVDFSNDYKAAGMIFAQGWGGNGNFAILSAGADYETAEPFTQIALAHTKSYSNYTELAGNMGYNATSEADLAGGRIANDGLRFTKPTGKQKVYLTFVGGAGNIQAVIFYDKAFTSDDFHAAGDWEPTNGQLLKPNEKSNYSEVSTRLAYADSKLVYSPSGETRQDGSGGWGWTTDGVIVDYGTMDFGNGEYTQVVTYVNHWANNVNDRIEYYIDEVSEDNLIGSVFTGMELRDMLYAKATSLTKTVTGSHKVLAKWRGGSTNITDVDFCKGNIWRNMPDPDYAVLTKINETPTENAKCYTMRTDVPEGAIAIENPVALNRAQREGNGNFGWTGNNTVIKLPNIDFENGQYNKILMTYGTPNNDFMGYKDEANFSFYIDLESATSNIMLNDFNWGEPQSIVAGIDPIAVVRIQSTGGWGDHLTNGDVLAPVAGVHDVYVVYTIKNSNDQGANIFDYYLDIDQNVPTAVNDVKVTKVNNGIVFSIDGRIVRTNAQSLEGLDAGMYIFNGQKILVK
ncbi:MAG: hypothetical protein KBT10_10405 [Bacteroidales bacterium]|nr:hypothetical protein [Candidatus Sodaliphilus aphodohippi]